MLQMYMYLHRVYVYIKAIRHALSIESNDAIMGCFASMFFIFGLVDCFVLVIAVEPHSKIKGIYKDM